MYFDSAKRFPYDPTRASGVDYPHFPSLGTQKPCSVLVRDSLIHSWIVAALICQTLRFPFHRLQLIQLCYLSTSTSFSLYVHNTRLFFYSHLLAILWKDFCSIYFFYSGLYLSSSDLVHPPHAALARLVWSTLLSPSSSTKQQYTPLLLTRRKETCVDSINRD